MTVSHSQLSLFETVQGRLGDRFTPFLIGETTFNDIERALSQMLERSERGIALVGLPGTPGDRPSDLSHLNPFGSADHQLFVLSGADSWQALVPSQCQVFAVSSSRKLLRERFWLTISESYAALMLGSQQSAPHLDGAPPLVSFWTSDPEAIAAAVEVALQAIAEVQPKRVDAVRAAFDAFTMPVPNAREWDRVTNLFIQSLENTRDLHPTRTSAKDSTERDELAQALAAKDEFIKSISEKLCTPLTNIKTAIQLLRSPHIKETQKAKYWDVLNSECNHQISLIDSLSELIQLEDSERIAASSQQLRLFDLIPGTVSTFQAIAQEQGIMLAYTVPADLPAVDFSEADLKQVLVKLIENALQVTPAGGQVWIAVSASGSKFIQIEVRDTGLGIPADAIPKIFDRFYRVPRTKLETTGVGLGLTVVQKLLLRAGGAISVQSKLGQGSTFTVMLPQQV